MNFASQISLLAQLAAYFRATLANEKLFRKNFAAAIRIQLGKWKELQDGRRNWNWRRCWLSAARLAVPTALRKS